MKNINIRYYMHRDGEIAEDGITVPMLPELAAPLEEGNSTEPLDALLNALAELQGYECGQFCGAAESEK